LLENYESCTHLLTECDSLILFASKCSISGDIQLGGHVHRTTAAMQLRAVPRHSYTSKFVPTTDDGTASSESGIADDEDDDLADLQYAEDPLLVVAHQSMVEAKIQSQQAQQQQPARTVSRNWVVRAAGVCPYPSRAAESRSRSQNSEHASAGRKSTSPDIAVEEQKRKARQMMHDPLTRAKLVDQLLQINS
jgi:ABC-type proline/glycine betaine transport system ATPase subunit